MTPQWPSHTHWVFSTSNIAQGPRGSSYVGDMEFDPETNTYTSHGPTARLRDAEKTSKDLRRRVATLEAVVDDLTERLERLEGR